MIETEQEQLPGAKSRYSKQFFFNNDKRLVKTIEFNNERIKYYDWQEKYYEYENNRIRQINQVRVRKEDTVRAIIRLSYKNERLIKVVETDTKSGDTLLLSTFIYDHNKVTEKSYVKQWAEIRTTYNYETDKAGWISKFGEAEISLAPGRKLPAGKLKNVSGFEKFRANDYR